MYVGSVTLAKVSILLFYQRIFQIRKPFRIASWAVGFLVFGFFVSNEFGLIFSFSPVEAQWKVWMPFTTIKIVEFWVAEGIINIVLDFIVLCLPQPLVWKLKMSWKQKVLLSGVFCLGILYVHTIVYCKNTTNNVQSMYREHCASSLSLESQSTEPHRYVQTLGTVVDAPQLTPRSYPSQGRNLASG